MPACPHPVFVGPLWVSGDEYKTVASCDGPRATNCGFQVIHDDGDPHDWAVTSDEVAEYVKQHQAH